MVGIIGFHQGSQNVLVLIEHFNSKSGLTEGCSQECMALRVGKWQLKF